MGRLHTLVLFCQFLGDKQSQNWSISKIVIHNESTYVVFFLLGDSPASGFSVPTFWDTLSVPSS